MGTIIAFLESDFADCFGLGFVTGFIIASGIALVRVIVDFFLRIVHGRG